MKELFPGERKELVRLVLCLFALPIIAIIALVFVRIVEILK